MDQQEKFAVIRRKTRQRFLFTGITLLLYFSFVLNWTGAGAFLQNSPDDSMVRWSLWMFIALIVFFVVLELVFLFLNRDEDRGDGGDR